MSALHRAVATFLTCLATAGCGHDAPEARLAQHRAGPYPADPRALLHDLRRQAGRDPAARERLAFLRADLALVATGTDDRRILAALAEGTGSDPAASDGRRAGNLLALFAADVAPFDGDLAALLLAVSSGDAARIAAATERAFARGGALRERAALWHAASLTVGLELLQGNGDALSLLGMMAGFACPGARRTGPVAEAPALAQLAARCGVHDAAGDDVPAALQSTLLRALLSTRRIVLDSPLPIAATFRRDYLPTLDRMLGSARIPIPNGPRLRVADRALRLPEVADASREAPPDLYAVLDGDRAWIGAQPARVVRDGAWQVDGEPPWAHTSADTVRREDIPRAVERAMSAFREPPPMAGAPWRPRSAPAPAGDSSAVAARAAAREQARRSGVLGIAPSEGPVCEGSMARRLALIADRSARALPVGRVAAVAQAHVPCLDVRLAIDAGGGAGGIAIEALEPGPVPQRSPLRRAQDWSEVAVLRVGADGTPVVERGADSTRLSLDDAGALPGGTVVCVPIDDRVSVQTLADLLHRLEQRALQPVLFLGPVPRTGTLP